ncbi:MAG: SPOR domain-containing protein [Magnetospirillum sp.]|nr:SPOR domain-containing protein [Magnetospirillum sp.]
MAPRPGDEFDRNILDIIPERFDADEDSRQARSGYRLRTGLTMLVAAAAVGGVVALGWRVMAVKGPADPGIPVIKADDRPIKTRPDDRGGMPVPNQDKLIYGRMEGEGAGAQKTEHLLPPPEQPKVPPKAEDGPPPKPAGITESIRPTAIPISAPPQARPNEPPLPKAMPQQPVVAEPLGHGQQQAAAPVAAPPAPAANYTPVQSRPAPPPAPVAPPQPVAAAPAPAPVKAAPAGGDYLIQLSSLRSHEAADKEWGRIQKANGELLSTLKADVVQVDLGGKGTFWRLRAGPLSDTAARQLCQELAKRNQGCIVARK